MSAEKLLGFYEKDVKGKGMPSWTMGYLVPRNKLVPVRLFSESVSFEEYKKTTEHLQKQIRYWVDIIDSKRSCFLMCNFSIRLDNRILKESFFRLVF